eukprot:SM000165S02196  [mRNA]  locus=s165:118391:120556:+ [translate_table: standard]
MDELGIDWLDLRPLTEPRTDLAAADGLHYSGPVLEAMTQLWLSTVCAASPRGPAAAEPSAAVDQSLDVEEVPMPPLAPSPPEVDDWSRPDQVFDSSVLDDQDGGAGEVGGRRGSSGRGDEGGVSGDGAPQKEWEGGELLEKIRMETFLPGSREVFVSFEQLQAWRKVLKAAEAGGNASSGEAAAAGSAAPSPPPLLGGPTRIDFCAGLPERVAYTPAVRLDNRVTFQHFAKCRWYRKTCKNHGKAPYSRNCRPKHLTPLVATGLLERCGDWCPSATWCLDGNLPANGTWKTMRRDPAVLVHPPFLAAFRDVFVSRLGDIYTDRHLFDPRGECYGIETARTHLRTDAARGLQHPVKRVYVMDGFGDGPFHAVYECLSRLAPYYSTLLDESNIMIHVNGLEGSDGEVDKQLLQMLAYLGFPRDRVVSHDIFAKEAIVAQAPCRIPFNSTEAIYLETLRDIVISRLPDAHRLHAHPGQGLGTVLVMSNPWHRRVANEAALMRTLASLSNRTVERFVDDGALSVVELWPMFHRADVVVAPHGSALAHLIACRRDTVVIEMMQPWSDNGDPAGGSISFELLSVALNLQYHVFVPHYFDPHAQGKDGDSYFVVDLRKMAPNLEKVFANLTWSYQPGGTARVMT